MSTTRKSEAQKYWKERTNPYSNVYRYCNL